MGSYEYENNGMLWILKWWEVMHIKMMGSYEY